MGSFGRRCPHFPLRRSEIWVALGVDDRIFRSVRSETWVALGVDVRIFRSVGVKYG